MSTIIENECSLERFMYNSLLQSITLDFNSFILTAEYSVVSASFPPFLTRDI